MLTPDGYASLTNIYDAAVSLGRWRRALDAVSGAVGAKAIALLIRRPDPSARDLTMLNSSYLKFTRTPSGLYYGLRLSRLQDPDWDFLSRQDAHRLALDTEIGPSPDDLDQRADYAFLRKKLGLRRRLGVRLNSDKVWFDAMSIAFDADMDNLPRTALDAVEPLLPHLTKAVEIGRTFAQLKSRYSAVLTALDRVKVGLAIALPSGELIVQNDEARRIFDLKDGLARSVDGHIICADADQTSALKAFIVRAAMTAQGESDFPESLMAIRRTSDGSSFLIDVAPLSDSNAEIDTGLQGALITVIDPDRVPYLRMQRFVTLYGLTPAEAEVCKLIVQGLSVDEIAEERSTSPVTAKNQIAAIFSKTSVNRRAELIRLVIRVLPPVE